VHRPKRDVISLGMNRRTLALALAALPLASALPAAAQSVNVTAIND
jgi:hypothetical protein